ncbi:hypothetical protein KAFR_0G01200 [Kazachstania africana CBS 2517]|uniref:non-specific serine/threonine protein kinase n=1 Tax=Kazachstania africana (strain ATCC 22294 / BCRC 22015 / CBS 2517 / CECT 1963 / NBRC 1671 / NRRL Y-8276) TaxID=1071382 RepID=H2AXQ4_KAZAF|nr:hypothetical protein KAFR_0G01200 [Kazachstania africana CBS 2517]CCF59154.1 hypothetical protein KAFR_0G01200 [Kazachstania africana CBS 2517]
MNNSNIYNILPPSSLFDIKECVGRGNFGDVYKAIDNITKKYVAIKVINLEYSDEDIDLLAQEIFFLAELKSDYIINYITTIMEDVSMWIVMDYCGGGSCSDLIKIVYPNGIVEEKVSFIVKNVLLGLQYLHEQKKIHRDIKAANILLTDDGQVKLGDFGVSGQIKATLKRDTFVGTPYWMAPEVINKEINNGYDEKVDIWSLGITTYELLKGVPPLSKYDPVKVMTSLVKRKPPKLHGPYNDFTKSFISFCLIKDPKLRPNVQNLLKTDFIFKFNGKIKNLQKDVDLCKKIKNKENGNFIKKPKFPINEKFYNTNDRKEPKEIWDFNTIHSMKSIKNNSSLISPTSDLHSLKQLSPISNSSQLQNASSTDQQFTKVQTITPLTVNSKSFKKVRVLTARAQYELGSGMDIDTDSQRKEQKNNCDRIEDVTDYNGSNKRENVDYFKNVICYSLKRMNERANDEDTKNFVNAILYNFKLTEAQVPGFSEVFMEEILLRMETIQNYFSNKV